MSKFHFVRQLATTALIGFLMVGCSNPSPTPLPEQMDKSPFTGDPCSAPCWYGLLIGESTENEALSTIPTLTFIDPNSVQLFREGSAIGSDPKNYNYAAEIVAKCIHADELCLTLKTVDYTLTEIEITLNYEITVREALRYLGTPDFLGYKNIGLEPVSCEINIVWYDEQLVLASQIFEGHEAVEKCGAIRETSKAEADLLLSQVRYVSQEAIEILLVGGSGTEFFKFSGTLP